jgi:hypothetical protein
VEEAIDESIALSLRMARLILRGFWRHFLLSPAGWVILAIAVGLVLATPLRPAEVSFHAVMFGLAIGSVRAWRRLPSAERRAIKAKYAASFHLDYFTYGGTRSRFMSWVGLIITWIALVMVVITFVSIYGVWLYVRLFG